jgi:hypothetical protein
VLEITGMPAELLNILIIRCEIPLAREQDSNLRPTDSKCRNLEIQKWCNYKQLILFHFFNQLLVSFGNVWKYLTLTGTIWGQP